MRSDSTQFGFTQRRIPLVLALLVTCIAFIFFSRGDAGSQGTRQTTLLQEATSFKQTLQDRLRNADHALERAARDPNASSLLQISTPYFKAVNYIDESGQITPLLGAQLNLADQTEATKIHLAHGDSALLALPSPTGNARIILLRSVVQDQNEGNESNTFDLLTAELSPAYLWKNESPSKHQLVILSQRDQQVLFASSTPDLAMMQTLRQPLRLQSGELQWNDGNNSGKASYTALPLREQFASDDWNVIAASPQASMLVSKASDGVMTASIVLALFLAWLTTLRPRRARAGPHSVGGQLMISHPLDIVRAMDEFDRAILSNASFNNIIELVFTNVPKVIPCVLVAVTHLDDTTPEQQSTWVNALDETQAVTLPPLDSKFKESLSSDPNGLLIEHPDKQEFLKPLAEFGAARLHLFPVYREGELSAILHFGLSKDKTLTEGEHHFARSFADRLGVALTSVMRGKELYMQEHFDPVTGLPNRAFCRDRLSQEISRARRKKLLVAIIYINLAGFKKVNDSLGYAGGDHVLNEVAQRLLSKLRESDVVSRFGNDEFVVLLPDLNNSNEIGFVAEKLVSVFGSNFAYEGQTMHLGAVMGISIYPTDGESIDNLFHYAEMAMTRVKASGQTQYVYYEEHMNSKAVERLKLEHDLRQAVNTDGEIFLVYQPQIDLRSGAIAGVEALVRWQHPTRGLVNPGEFINIAEETGIIIKMSDTIRHIACKQFVDWVAKGIAPPRIAVNISSQDLRRATFTEEVLATLKHYGVSTANIELEITESMFVDATGGVVDVLRNLQKEGFLIAIDDFGTGYSSLSYLGLLPFDILKVDRSFVLGIGKPSEKIVAVIVDVAHTFEKSVIAEGVDAEHQHVYLKDLGCEIIQGFLFSKPLVADDFEKYATKMAAEFGRITTH
ncbi:MAG: putative bifunctional diguanylate cyclase/phosphodiesterase [Methylophilaceae bacterium]